MLASIKNLCRSEASIMVVEVLGFIRVEETTTTTMVEMDISITRELVTTIMAIGVTTTTTPLGQMAIIMAPPMAETTMPLRRRILVRWNALSSTKLGTMQVNAHRGRMKETSPIHFRRGMLITSM
jgi:hypothetical protein